METLTIEEYRQLLAQTKCQSRTSKPAGGSQLEAQLLLLLQTEGLPTPKQQFKFHPRRRWRSDFAWPEQKVIVEVEGGIHTNGRHVRGTGFEGDCEKYNEMALAGYTLIRVTRKQIENGQALVWIRQALTKE